MSPLCSARAIACTFASFKVLINDISIAFVNLCPHPINVGDNLIIPESKWIARKVSTGGNNYTKSHTDVLDFGDLEVRRMKELVYVKPLNKVGFEYKDRKGSW